MTALERRFRQILRLYPAAYRAIYEEEMIGVLMATARPGQKRPHWRDVLDLVRHAIAIRIRCFRGDDTWKEAAAIVSVVAPVFLCLGMAARLPISIIEFAVWPVCAALAMLGWRRSAATVAWLGAALLGYVVTLGVGVVAPWLVLAVLAAGALTWSDGATRGIHLLGWGRLVAVSGGVAFLGLAELNHFNYGMRYFGAATFEGGWAMLQMRFFVAVGVTLLVAGLFWLSGPGHGRAALVLVLPVTVLTVRTVVGAARLNTSGVLDDVVALLPFAALVAFAYVIIIERRAERELPTRTETR